MASQATGTRTRKPRLSRYLDPGVLNHVDRFELAAQQIVEGNLSGAQDSPHHGFAVEFAQHRAYTMGDDVRHLDWKVYSRTGRYYVKQYDVKTNYTAHILHDASESMLYGSSRATHSKMEYANFLTATLSYLVLRQTHSVGLGVFNESLISFVEPRQSFAHLHRVCAALEEIEPRGKTDTGRVLHEFAERIDKRGLVILVSDLLEPPDGILEGLNHMSFAGHEVIIFHLLDPNELEFPFGGPVKFEGLEGRPDLLCQPRLIRKRYLEALNDHIRMLKTACERNRVDYVLMSTAQPLDVALAGFLQSRALARMYR